MSSLARKHIQNGLEISRNQASLLKNLFTLFRKQRIGPKTLPREIVAREDEEEETSEVEGAETTSPKDQICSASIVERLGTGMERLGTHQISVGLRVTPSKTSITRRKMTVKIKMLVNLLILLLLHIVILDLMK